MADDPALTLTTFLCRNPDLVSVDMAGETVMMDVESGHYFGLDSVGSAVWHVLDQTCSVQAIIDHVRQTFSVGPEDDVEGDVMAFLRELHADRLVLNAEPE